MAYSFEDIKRIIEDDYDSGCKLVSDSFTGCNRNLEIQCKCKEIFKATITRFKSGKQQCNKCGRSAKRPKKDKLLYEDVVNEIESNNSRLKTTKCEYESKIYDEGQSPTQVELEIFCCDCKINTHKTNLRRLRERGKYHCYECSLKKRSWSFKEVKSYIEAESNSGCKLLSEKYEGVLVPLKIKCWCGKIYERPFCQFKDWKRYDCGRHKLPVGERIIMTYCDKYNIKYKSQFTYKDCKDIKVLPFDIAILNDDDDPILLIEYHGEQHYEPKGFGEKNKKVIMKKFKTQLLHDQIKSEYCKYNNIPLLVIPFWYKDNIMNILESNIHKYKEV